MLTNIKFHRLELTSLYQTYSLTSCLIVIYTCIQRDAMSFICYTYTICVRYNLYNFMLFICFLGRYLLRLLFDNNTTNINNTTVNTNTASYCHY